MLGSRFLKNFLSSHGKTVANTRGFSLQGPLCEIYPKEYLDPKPQPASYWTKRDPTMKFKDFKAAPSVNTYSNFYDTSARKFERMLLKKGKGYMAERLMQKTLENIKINQVKKYNTATNEDDKNAVEVDPLKVFNSAITNIKPLIGVEAFRKGAMNYQVPFPLKPRRQTYLAHKWVLQSTRLRKQTTRFVDRLTKEILAAYIGQGSAMKKKQALHKLADTNRAYAHLRWTPNRRVKKLRGRKAAKAKTSKFKR